MRVNPAKGRLPSSIKGAAHLCRPFFSAAGHKPAGPSRLCDQPLKSRGQTPSFILRLVRSPCTLPAIGKSPRRGNDFDQETLYAAQSGRPNPNHIFFPRSARGPFGCDGAVAGDFADGNGLCQTRKPCAACGKDQPVGGEHHHVNAGGRAYRAARHRARGLAV